MLFVDTRPFHKLQNDFFCFLAPGEQIFVSPTINDDMNAVGQTLCNFFRIIHWRKSIQSPADQERWDWRTDLALVIYSPSVPPYVKYSIPQTPVC